MKSPKVLIFAIALVALVSVVAFVKVPAANAGPLTCAIMGGEWTEIGLGHRGQCTFTGGNKWRERICTQQGFGGEKGYLASAQYILINGRWRIVGLNCWYAGSSEPEADGTSFEVDQAVTPGTPIDIFTGNCGAHLSNPPFNGTVKLGRYAGWGLPGGVKPSEVPTTTPVCQIMYLDANGEEMPWFGSPGWVYYNLDTQTSAMWDAGNLAFWVYQNGGWSACGNPMKVSFGENTEDGKDEFGRLACFSTDPLMFGLGNPPEE
jgi:hypothetical protein